MGAAYRLAKLTLQCSGLHRTAKKRTEGVLAKGLLAKHRKTLQMKLRLTFGSAVSVIPALLGSFEKLSKAGAKAHREFQLGSQSVHIKVMQKMLCD